MHGSVYCKYQLNSKSIYFILKAFNILMQIWIINKTVSTGDQGKN